MGRAMIFLFMLLVTVGVFVVPGLYYERIDTRLDENTQEYTYSIDMQKSMRFEDRVKILAYEQCGVEAVDNYPYSDELINDLADILCKKLGIMSWRQDKRLAYLEKMLKSDEALFNINSLLHFKVAYVSGDNMSIFYVGICHFCLMAVYRGSWYMMQIIKKHILHT